MGDITLSSSVRTNLLSLQNTAEMLGKTQERLATGLKVNSALDDPTSFFTASSLNSRAGDLSRLLDSIGNAVQTIQAADDGIAAITDLVENAQATARQALQTPGGNVQNVATVTSGTTIGADSAASVSGTAGIAADTAAIATSSGTLAGTTTLTAAGLADGDTLQVSVGGTSKTIVFNNDGDATGFDAAIDLDGADNAPGGGDDATVDDLISAFNTQLGAAATVDDGTNDQIRIESADTTSDVVITGSSASVLSSLNLDAVGTGSTTSRTVEPANADIAALSGALSFTVNSQVDTIRFGSDDSTGEVNTRAELEARLSALNSSSNTGASFSLNGSNQITVTAASANDGDITIGVTGTNVNTETGFTAGQVGERSNADLASLVAGNNTLTISDGTNTDTITFGTGSGQVTNKAELETALAALSTSGATGAINTSNQIVITGAEGETLTIGGSGGDAAAITLGLALSTAPTQTGVSTERAALETEFNELLTQIDDLAKDASFNGNNLLNGDSLKVIFNGDGSSSLDVTGVTFDSAGLGVNAAASDSFQSDTAINATLAELDSATASLRSQAATFGSNLSVVEVRNDFTKNLINTLETGADKLTLADLNQEGANALALQTRQQLSSVALSLSVQADQNVLRLF